MQPKLRLLNVRIGGFASNSSSSHSCWVLPQPRSVATSDDYYYGGQEFGWETFTLASPEAKLDYLTAALWQSLYGFSPELRLAIMRGLGFYEIADDPTIDHQSAFKLPSDWLTPELPDVGFLNALRDWLQRDDVFILGGNDNDGDHPDEERLENNADAQKSDLFGVLGDGPWSSVWVARYDKQYHFWTLFNRMNGAKFRFMFDRAETLASERYNRDGDSVSPWQPERASVPELVDISVSDMCPYDCNYCAPPGTQVQTPDGDRPIEEIKLGDVVYSADPLTGQTIEETVTQVFERDYEGDLIEIELENGRILRLTPNHEVYTANRGWVEAGDLTEEDNLVGISEYAYA